MPGRFISRIRLDKDGNQMKAKDGTGMTQTWTDPEAWGLSVPTSVSDACMMQGRTTHWDPAKMRPVMLQEDYPQPEKKVLKRGTYIMATRNGKLRVVPSPEMRRQFGSASEAVKAAVKMGLIPEKKMSDKEMLETMRGWSPTYRLQVIATGGADAILQDLADCGWMKDDEKVSVRARAYRAMEEHGKGDRRRAYKTSDLGAGEEVVEAPAAEADLDPEVKLGPAGAGAEDEEPVTVGG